MLVMLSSKNGNDDLASEGLAQDGFSAGFGVVV